MAIDRFDPMYVERLMLITQSLMCASLNNPSCKAGLERDETFVSRHLGYADEFMQRAGWYETLEKHRADEKEREEEHKKMHEDIKARVEADILSRARTDNPS